MNPHTIATLAVSAIVGCGAYFFGFWHGWGRGRVDERKEWLSLGRMIRAKEQGVEPKSLG